MNPAAPIRKRILILAANPRNTPPLRLAEEVRDIQERLQGSQNHYQFVLEQRWAARPRDIQSAMLFADPQIVHFSGHGAGEEGLAFEDATGQTKFIDSDGLAGLFAEFPKVECVVLNACYSEVQARAIAQHVRYVVGMSRAISDGAALEFSVGFYTALCAGRDVAGAYRSGCAAIRLAGFRENETPVLMNQQGILHSVQPPSQLTRHESETLNPPTAQPSTASPTPSDPNSSINLPNELQKNLPVPRQRLFRLRKNKVIVFTAIFLVAVISVIAVWRIFIPQIQPSAFDYDWASFGEKSIITDETSGCQELFGENPDKKKLFDDSKSEGVEEMKEGKNYEQAAELFRYALDQGCKNAPETLIYWNNAQIAAKKEEAFTVAVIVPYDKEKAQDDAVRMLRGFAQAQDEVNAVGGINIETNLFGLIPLPKKLFGLIPLPEKKVKLKVLVIKDNDEADKAERIASALVEQPNVLAVLGHWSSGTSLKAAEDYNEHKMVFITPISIMDDADPNVSKLRPYFFRANATIDKGASALAKYMGILSNRAFIFYDSDNIYYSGSLKDKFKAAIGTQYFGEYDLYKLRTSNDVDGEISTLVEEILNNDPQPALVLFPSNESASEAIRIAIKSREISQNPPPLIGDMANLVAQKTLDEGKDLVRGMVLAPSWNSDGSSDENKDSFGNKAVDLWQGQVDWTSAMSYNAMQAIIKALEKHQTREGIQKELTEGTWIPGASGDFSFQKTGSANTEVQQVELRASRKDRCSKTESDFFSLSGGAPSCLDEALK